MLAHVWNQISLRKSRDSRFASIGVSRVELGHPETERVACGSFSIGHTLVAVTLESFPVMQVINGLVLDEK
jgi:hypothetical protein